MKRSIWLKILSMALVLILAAAWLPVSMARASASGGGTVPPGLPVIDSGGSGDGDFVPGEVLALAESWEHAQTIAEAYGLELKSFASGIAVLVAPDPEQAVARSGMMRRAGIPKLGLNWIYHTSESAPKASYQKDTYSRTAVTHDPYSNVSRQQTGLTRVTYGGEDEPYYPGQWHRAEMDMERAWGLSAGKDVVIAVIDTGIDIDHSAFSGRISEKSYNAYTDQIGIEYVQDDIGHGTHVSGIAAASMDEAADVCGVAPEAELLVIKANASDSDEFWSETLYRAIAYAVENGADVINMSLGRPYADGEYADAVEQQVIANAVASGTVVVCAAGNDGDSHAGYPAAYPESIAVSATRQGYVFDNIYSVSNYGPEIDISAPGGDIYSSIMGGEYGSMSGTSMASPNAAGVAALILARNPSYMPEQVREALCETARDAGELGRDHYFGHGIVNAYAAVLGADALSSVTYDFNDGDRDPVRVAVVPGDTVTEPDAPRRDGFAFDGWYVSGTDEAYDFTDPVEGDIGLYAHWVEAEVGMYILEFPDPNFRREVLREVNARDGGRRKESRFVADDLDVLSSIEELYFPDMSIRDMTGLAYFTGLGWLFCSRNELTELDTSGCSSLEFLFCDQNYRLETLDVSKNTALRELSCNSGQLTELDVTKNTDLEILSCADNLLSELDVSNNTKLSGYNDEYYFSLGLDCSFNRLTALDVSQNTELKVLLTASNHLTALDVSVNHALEFLDCSFNYMSSVDKVIDWQSIPGLILDETFLFYPQLSGNPPAGEDITAAFKDPGFLAAVRDIIGKPDGPVLDYDVAQIKELYINGSSTEHMISDLSGIEHFESLTFLSCYNQQLTAVDLAQNALLEYLDVGYNQLDSIDVAQNHQLQVLWLDNNNLETLDLSGNTQLISLWAHSNHLTEINVTGLALEHLNVSYNYLPGESAVIGFHGTWDGTNYIFEPQRSIPVDITAAFTDPNFRAAVYEVIGKTAPEPILSSDVEMIEWLEVFERGIRSLAGLEHFTGLLYLNCYNNQLAVLPALPKGLESIECGENMLASLPELPDSLEWLGCGDNQLASLPELPNGLRSLDCSDNQLATLPELPDSLVWLICAGNQLSSLPALPDGLDVLFCAYNVLTSLPALPEGLRELICSQNRLTGLDVTGAGLEFLDGRYNYMTDESDVVGFLGEWDESYFFFWPQHPEGFKAVTNLVDLPRFATVGEPLTLTGTVIPADATNQTIEWHIEDDPDETGATLDGNLLTAASPGVVYMVAVIPDALSATGGDWSFPFTITVLPKTYTVTFDLNGGTRTGGGELVQEIPAGGAAVAPTVSRSSHTFSGWDKLFDHVTADLTVTAQWTPSGGGGGVPAATTYTVTFHSNGGSEVPSQSVASGGKAIKPADPTRADHTFEGWYSDAALATLYDFDHTVTANLVLYAKWTETITELPLAARIRDISASDWFYSAVAYVFENGLMLGTGDDWFSPNSTMSRAMLVTVLYRLEGEPPVTGGSTFSDVRSGQWYTAAIAWASENGIVDGYDSGVFGVDDPVTREQTVTILYRYAKYKQLDVGDLADLSKFTDMDDISDWALDAMRWAVERGIIEGRPDSKAAPKDVSSRAEIATIVMRYKEGFLGDGGQPEE